MEAEVADSSCSGKMKKPAGEGAAAAGAAAAAGWQLKRKRISVGSR
jgi:hypothetical protein